MNTLLQCNNNEKGSIYDKHDAYDKNCIHPTPGKVLLKCTKGNLPITNINIVGPTFFQTFNQPIASVTIDTTYLKCPSVLIDFAGILTISPNSFLRITTTFTLFKTCKERKTRQAIATYNFNIEYYFTNFPDSETIKFEYSPCDDQCEDCCIYTLEFTSVSSFFNSVGNISVDGTLCILAVDSSS